MGFWIHKNQANDKNYKDGLYWTFNSIRALKKLFPYWSIPQLKRIIKKLLDKGALKSANYNKVKYDQTKWYTIIDPIALVEYNIAFGDNGNSIGHIGTFEGTESENEKSEMSQPIPDSKQNSKTKDNKLCAGVLKSERKQMRDLIETGGNWIMEDWESPTSLYKVAVKKFAEIPELSDLKLDVDTEVKIWLDKKRMSDLKSPVGKEHRPINLNRFLKDTVRNKP